MKIENTIRSIREKRDWINKKMDNGSDTIVAEQIFYNFEDIMDYVLDTLTIIAGNKAVNCLPVTTMDRIREIIKAIHTEKKT